MLTGSVILLLVGSGLLALLEWNNALAALPTADRVVQSLFISAISTVGSSMGITPLFGPLSKIVLVLLMFAGRVGLITILMSITSQTGDTRYRFPQDNIIIN